MSQAHRKHAYQRLAQSGWAHDRVAIFSVLVNMVLVNMVLFGLVYFLSNVFIAFIVSVILLYGVVRFVDSRKKFE